MRKRDRYADRLRDLPWFADLTLAEARLVARLVDDVIVDGERVLVFGAREREALLAAIPRLEPRLQSFAGRDSSTPTSAPRSSSSAARTRSA